MLTPNPNVPAGFSAKSMRELLDGDSVEACCAVTIRVGLTRIPAGLELTGAGLTVVGLERRVRRATPCRFSIPITGIRPVPDT